MKTHIHSYTPPPLRVEDGSLAPLEEIYLEEISKARAEIYLEERNRKKLFDKRLVIFYWVALIVVAIIAVIFFPFYFQ